MNEEIKFRIYDKEFNQFSYLTFDNRGLAIYNGSLPMDEKKVGEMQQFVNLKDKNNKEGYFSDWVRLFDGEEGELVKDWGFGSIGIHNLRHFRSMENIYLAYLKANKLDYANLSETWEIIGNVNENPELKNK